MENDSPIRAFQGYRYLAGMSGQKHSHVIFSRMGRIYEAPSYLPLVILKSCDDKLKIPPKGMKANKIRLWL